MTLRCWPIPPTTRCPKVLGYRTMSYPNLVDQTAFITLFGINLSHYNATIVVVFERYGGATDEFSGQATLAGLFVIGCVVSILLSGIEFTSTQWLFRKLSERWELKDTDLKDQGFFFSIVLMVIQLVVLAPILLSLIPNRLVVSLVCLMAFPLSVIEVCAIVRLKKRFTSVSM